MTVMWGLALVPSKRRMCFKVGSHEWEMQMRPFPCPNKTWCAHMLISHLRLWFLRFLASVTAFCFHCRCAKVDFSAKTAGCKEGFQGLSHTKSLYLMVRILVGGQGHQHDRAKSFHEHCRFLSSVLSLLVLRFRAPRCQDCTLMTIARSCTRKWGLKEQKKKRENTTCCFCHFTWSDFLRQVSDAWGAAVFHKISWISSSHVWWSEPLPGPSPFAGQSDTVTRRHCSAGMSHSVLCYLDRNGEWVHILKRHAAAFGSQG